MNLTDREKLVYAGDFNTNGNELRLFALGDSQWLSKVQNHLLIGLSFSQAQVKRGEELVRELTTIVRAKKPSVKCELVALNTGLCDYDFGSIGWRTLDTRYEIQIYSNFVGEPLAIPDIFLENVSVVTLCEAGVLSEFGVCGPCLAQVGWLAQSNNSVRRHYGIELAYEAYRLIGVDFCLCFGKDYWLASRSMVAMDTALARAAGFSPDQLPLIKYFSQREMVDLSSVETAGKLPQFSRHGTSSLWGMGARISRSVGRAHYRLRKDAALAYENRYRIRPFLKNRLGV